MQKKILFLNIALVKKKVTADNENHTQGKEEIIGSQSKTR